MSENDDLLAMRTQARVADLPVKVAGRIDEVAGHWLWNTPAKNGYAYHYGPFPGDPTRAPSRQPAHRLVYELLVRVIPTGLELDHTCVFRNCVRPTCLDEVTHAENQRRGGWRIIRCRKRGHLFTPDNTIRLGETTKTCRECVHESDRRRTERRAAARGREVGRARGEECGSAKLTDEQVRAIRRDAAAGGTSLRGIGRHYGVSVDTIIRIVKGDGWKHVA